MKFVNIIKGAGAKIFPGSCLVFQSTKLWGWKSVATNSAKYALTLPLKPNELDPKEYPEFDEFLHMLGVLHDFQERTALNSGATGDWNSVIAKLVLAKHGYTDQTNLNLGGQGQNRPIIIKTIGCDYDNNSNE